MHHATVHFLHHLQEIQDQLKGGADPNQYDGLNRTSLLHKACSRGSTEIVELLLCYGANPSLCDSKGNAPLSQACRDGNLAIADVIVSR